MSDGGLTDSGCEQAQLDTKEPEAPTERLMQRLSGFWITKSACLAVQLDIPDLIGDGIVSAESLAKQLKVDEHALYRMLRALTCAGVFDEVSPRHFSNTEMSHCLREDSPHSMKALFQLTGEDWKWKSWGQLDKIIRQGKFVLDDLYGYQSIFEYFAAEPERGAIFDEAMSRHAIVVHAASIDAYDFAHSKTVVDIGGGAGTFLTELLSRYSEMTGVLFDQQHIVEKAHHTFAGAGIEHRVSIESGSFFERVPAGGDLYVFGMIMHNWGDEDCIKILSNLRKVMKPSSKVVLLEYVIPEGKEPHFAKILDMEMLITYREGRERTEKEFREIFEAAGLTLTRIIPTFCGSSVVEAMPKTTH